MTTPFTSISVPTVPRQLRYIMLIPRVTTASPEQWFSLNETPVSPSPPLKSHVTFFIVIEQIPNPRLYPTSNTSMATYAFSPSPRETIQIKAFISARESVVLVSATSPFFLLLPFFHQQGLMPSGARSFGSGPQPDDREEGAPLSRGPGPEMHGCVDESMNE